MPKLKNGNGKPAPSPFFEDVKLILCTEIAIEEPIIDEKAHLVDDLKLDSLDHTEFIMALEDKYDLEIPDDDAEKLTTVDQVTAYLEKNVKTS